MGQTARTYYEQRVSELIAEEIQYKKKLNERVLLRLVFFAIAASGFFIFGGTWPAWLCFGVGIVLFFATVKRHLKLKTGLKVCRLKIAKCKNEMAVLEGDYSAFALADVTVSPDHSYAHDLDLFGTKSIFSLLNRANTNLGIAFVANRLKGGRLSREEILATQKATERIATEHAWREEFFALGQLYKAEPGAHNKLVDWINEDFDSNKALLTFLGVFVPIWSASAVVLSAVGVLSAANLLIMLAVSLIPAGLKLKLTMRHYHALTKSEAIINQYAVLFEQVQKLDTNGAPKLEFLKAGLASANKQVQSLRSVADLFNQRNNVVVVTLFNVFLGYDFWCLRSLLNWKKSNALDLPKWLDQLAELEWLSSLGTLRFNYEGTTSYASILELDHQHVVGVEMGHPFIPDADRVDNDFEANGAGYFHIITGANMAGKSTFLRSLGVNIVLGLAGAPVFAKSLALSQVELFSSMRANDSLQESASYFYAELSRLNQLVSHPSGGKMLFVILDEILKGTNSKDKAEGSAKFVEKLVSKGISGVVATHDLSLCTLAEKHPAAVNNLFFDVGIGDNDLTFDYKLRQGICENMNATFLMKKMGITD